MQPGNMAKRLAKSAAYTPMPSGSPSASLPILPFRPATHCQRRHAGSWFGFGGSRSTAPSASDSTRGQAPNPLLKNYLEKKPSLQQEGHRMPTRGGLTPSNIFDESGDAGDAQKTSQSGRDKGRAEKVEGKFPKRDLAAMAVELDPQPGVRMRWEAKMVMRQVRRRGRMSKAEVIKQTERSHTTTSPMLKTSTKKLGMLARQIAGKTLDEAMVQMRFSTKKAAKGVLKHLGYAKDSAIVRQGMALGAVQGEAGEPIMIRDKNGNRVKVTDTSSMYIDEAWVNRGKYALKPEYRARGRVNVLRLPHTSLTVVLKEEATRVRLHHEREEKEAKRKVWVPMPNRPIMAQHQYPLW